MSLSSRKLILFLPLLFLLLGLPALHGQQPRGRIGGGQLIGVIQTTVRPDSWEERGGNGVIMIMPPVESRRNNAAARRHAGSEQLIETIKTTIRPDSWE